MRKRLRKKLHKGEFTEYGFHVFIKFIETDDEYKIGNFTYDDWFDVFIEEVERHKLDATFGGSFKDFSAYLAANPSGKTATNNDRNEMAKWLSTQSIVKSFEVKELADAWNTNWDKKLK